MEASDNKQSNPSYTKHHNSFGVCLLITIACAIVVGFGLCIGLGIYNNYKANKSAESGVQTNSGSGTKDSVSVTESVTLETVQHIVSTSDFSAIADCVLPSIVSIDCTSTYTAYSFWGQPQNYEASSSGTGFFVTQNSNKLYILTNNHVIDGADAVTVTLCDGSTASAEIIGKDIGYDLAIIAINIADLDGATLSVLRIASLSNSENIKVGDMTVAIGNALGYGQSLTVGYVSALNREVTVDGYTKALIQTDTAINPGNSGGPLLNIYGQVIGINSIKFASEEIEGMGYAIPISSAIPIINELIDTGTISEWEIGYLGIEGKDVSESYSIGFNMPVGVYIYSIVPNSAAASADLNVGDIITKINGRAVKSEADLQNRLTHYRVGQTVTLTVETIQSGKYVEREVEVILGRRP